MTPAAASRLPGPALAVISPHLDDALLSCYTALSARRVLVVNVCTGEPAPGTVGEWDRATEAVDSGLRMRERLAEDADALAAAGATWRNLGFLEEQYRDGSLDGGELAAALEGAIPAGVPVLAPAGVGDHPDHLALGRAALALSERRGVPLFLFADLPYASWATEGAAARAADLRPVGLRSPGSASRFAGGPELVTLTESARAEKLALALGYRSQLRGAGAGLLDWLRSPNGASWEAFWPVNPAQAVVPAGQAHRAGPAGRPGPPGPGGRLGRRASTVKERRSRAD